ncbi:hypothetical protein EH223_10595 [candidate division KSB1 bacterium]|nr:hypothetical protein [candidate division KSB1 bacterium]RQW03204.1 MAG: hypothetical protein EH223_10595 [candidate division KSB1 bacterium]
MSFPRFYNPDRIGTLFYPNVAEIAADAEMLSIQPADEDKTKLLLMIIDMQVDFCHEPGSLFVPGAPGDVQRVIEFIYQNAERITSIICSLDSHYPIQIFHPVWWADAQGRHPEPFTIISVSDVEHGTWRPLRQRKWSIHYVKQLQQKAKKQLTIWPYHVPIGGVGNALDPELWSAVFWHSIARKSQPVLWTKGSLAKTEHYSIIRPEIEITPQQNQPTVDRFVDLIDHYDYVYLAGEAESHCVLETIKDIVDLLQAYPDKLSKIFILQDCMSAVVHPEIDFHALAREEFAKYEEQGIQFVSSTDALAE